jgi:predicted DCC family thiol-disulfide oxidoreductase YuxK
VGHPVLLYDGVCGLCNRMVRFVLRRDHDQIFRFASLQSGLAQHILAAHGVNAVDLDSIYIVTNYDFKKLSKNGADNNEALLARSDAVLFVAHELGGMLRVLATFLGGLPLGFREWGYRIVARNRYRIFGRYDACLLPSEETRARFLDL